MEYHLRKYIISKKATLLWKSLFYCYIQSLVYSNSCRRLQSILVGKCLERELAAAIKAVGTHLTLRQTDSLDELFDGIELQSGESQFLCNLVHHALILGRVGGGILVEVFVRVALKLLDHTAGDKLHIALR